MEAMGFSRSMLSRMVLSLRGTICHAMFTIFLPHKLLGLDVASQPSLVVGSIAGPEGPKVNLTSRALHQCFAIPLLYLLFRECAYKEEQVTLGVVWYEAIANT